VRLAGSPGIYARAGTFTSVPLSAGFPCEEVLPSWNIYSPPGCGFCIELRAGGGDRWSSWLYLGSFGGVGELAPKKLADEWGKVQVDYLALATKAQLVQYRVRLFSSDPCHSPEIRLFALACSGSGTQAPRSRSSPLRNVRLPVPFRSQGTEDPRIAGDICSPTCVAMVMEYWGIKRPTAEIARIVYDREYEMYGIWPRAVQAASQYGLKGWVQRFRRWEEVEEMISRGQPVIASIAFGAGELSGSPTESSEGHLIVVCGFDGRGNPICNDPAWRSASDGVLVYDRGELARAWFSNSAVGYVIGKR
jgi:hypothetical protein